MSQSEPITALPTGWSPERGLSTLSTREPSHYSLWQRPSHAARRAGGSELRHCLNRQKRQPVARGGQSTSEKNIKTVSDSIIKWRFLSEVSTKEDNPTNCPVRHLLRLVSFFFFFFFFCVLFLRGLLDHPLPSGTGLPHAGPQRRTKAVDSRAH